MRIKIENVLIVTVNENMDILENQNLYINENKIEKIVSVEKDTNDLKVDKIIDGKGKLLMPGMINMHSHLPMTILRNYSDDVALEEWLEDIIWPIEAKLTAEDIGISTRFGLIEMISTGTTFYNDMYYELDAMAKETEKAGMRALLGRGITEKESEEETQAVLDDVENFHLKYKDKDGLIKGSFAPHAIYTSSFSLLERVKKIASKYDPIIHIHLSETKTEYDNCVKKYGMSPTKVFDKLGLLSKRTVAAHCIWLDDEDIEILKKRDVSVIHNPSSNMKLASGFCPVQRLLDEGINVCLGTDGASSNNHLDMFKEMNLASLIQKGYTLNPKALNKKDALRMATINGAKALGMEDEIGSIEEEKLADLILLDFEQVNYYPRNDILSSLVYSSNGKDVSTVIINGKIVMEDKKILTIDEKITKEEADKTMKDLIER